MYSDFTSGELYREGSGRGAIDPCFPAKIGIAHVHNLIFAKHAKKPLDAIFFPMIDMLHTPLKNLQRIQRLSDGHGHARSREGRVHEGRRRVRGSNGDHVSRSAAEHRRTASCSAQQMFRRAGADAGTVSEEENERAIEVGFQAARDVRVGHSRGGRGR